MKTIKYLHDNAFCVMTYRSTEGKFEERIWNSRDGVTPSVVYARDGETLLQHVNSEKAQDAASYRPKIGDRIFIDMTRANIIANKRGMVEREWANPEFQRIVVKSLVSKLGSNPSPEMIAQHLVNCEFQRSSAPSAEVVVVDHGVLQRLRFGALKPRRSREWFFHALLLTSVSMLIQWLVPLYPADLASGGHN